MKMHKIFFTYTCSCFYCEFDGVMQAVVQQPLVPQVFTYPDLSVVGGVV